VELAQLRSVDPGSDADGLLVADVVVSGVRHSSASTPRAAALAGGVGTAAFDTVARAPRSG